MKLLTGREANDNLYRLIDEIAETHQPITIKGKGNDAVLVSREDWEAIAETIYLNSIPGMVESIRLWENMKNCCKEFFQEHPITILNSRNYVSY